MRPYFVLFLILFCFSLMSLIKNKWLEGIILAMVICEKIYLNKSFYKLDQTVKFQFSLVWFKY